MSTKKNVVSLYAVQLVSYALPLVTIPYLAHALGPIGIGAIGYAQTVATILLIFVEFGFDLTSTRRIAVNKADKYLVNKIYWTMLSAKVILAMIGSGILVVLAETVLTAPLDQQSILLANLYLWGGALTPTCVYQGLQRMTVFATLIVITRVFLLIPLFLLVKNANHVALAAALQFSPLLIAAIILTALAFQQGLIQWRFDVSFKDIVNEGKESYHVFVGNAFTIIYMYANVLLVKSINGNISLGFYVAADKLIMPLRQLAQPPLQAFFPKICRMYADGESEAVVKLVNKMIYVFIFCGLILFIGFSFIGKWFVLNLFGKEFFPTYQILQILILAPVISAAAAAFVQLRVIASGNQSELKKVYMTGAIFHFLQAPFLIYYWGGVGAACSAIATELLMIGFLICISSAMVYRHQAPEISQKTERSSH
ncbi:flippase [Caballeronia sp. LjRoot31]|uniref:flippase n=1 Tax=Caballeronia sp. LjRoot31 TaxID=3342324 RepID=UPI003ED00127